MEELLKKLRESGISIDLAGDNLKLDIPKGFDAKQLIGEIRANKQSLIDFIKGMKGKEASKKIEKAEEQESYVLSYAQGRLYFLYELYRDSLMYNMPFVLRLKGDLDKEKIESAFGRVIERHESLRTAFEVSGGVPVQRILTEYDFSMERFESNEEEAGEIVKNFIRPFDLSKAPLLRVGLIRLSDKEHVLMLDLHHIISDGLSMEILIRDFRNIYSGQEPAPLAIQYKDYATWQQSEEQQKVIQKQQEFWRKQFEEEISPLDLPLDYSRPAEKDFAGDSVDFKLTNAETGFIKELAKEERATQFMILLSVFNIMLSKISGQEDLVVGTPVSGRSHGDLSDIVGMFVNTLALRNKPSKNLTYREFLANVKVSTLATFDNQVYPFEELIDELNIERAMGRHSFFDVVFSIQNFKEEELELSGLEMSPFFNEDDNSKFDLSLGCQEIGDTMMLSFQYSTQLFKRATIEKFAGYFQQVVREIKADRNIRIGEITLMDRDEVFGQVTRAGGQIRQLPQNESILSLFEKNAEKKGDTIAVYDRERNVSYSQLNCLANTLANTIISKNSGRKERIALLFDPCIEMYAAIIAIMKAGGTYLAISPSVPADRNRAILNDAGCNYLLAAEKLREKATEYTSGTSVGIISVADKMEIDVQAVNPGITRQESDSIYIIYTSGSTGKPKGVEVSENGVLNTALFYSEKFGINKGVKVSQTANILFDASAMEILPCISAGGSLVVVPEEIRLDPPVMKEWLAENEIEVTFQPPIIAEYLLQQDWINTGHSLKTMTIGGDKLNYFPTTAMPFDVYNLYGPTEDSIVTTYTKVSIADNNDKYLIGKPIYNKKVLILDSSGQLLPDGVPGELCISGVGVAKGYINNTALTGAKFIDNPFIQGEKLYKTGDKARWTEDGQIEFMGRIDQQVKINGYRIELGDIESQLNALEGIRDAVVLARELNSSDPYLVGYYTVSGDLAEDTVRDHLMAALPKYMVPRSLMRLDEMPLSSSGKINRRMLPEPQIASTKAYISPQSNTEKQLVDVWAQVLDIPAERIGAKDNFFELGGTSLKTFQLKDAIRKSLEKEIDIVKLFEFSSVRDMAEFIDAGDQIDQAEMDQLDQLEDDSMDILGETLNNIG